VTVIQQIHDKSEESTNIMGYFSVSVPVNLAGDKQEDNSGAAELKVLVTYGSGTNSREGEINTSLTMEVSTASEALAAVLKIPRDKPTFFLHSPIQEEEVEPVLAEKRLKILATHLGVPKWDHLRFVAFFFLLKALFIPKNRMVAWLLICASCHPDAVDLESLDESASLSF